LLWIMMERRASVLVAAGPSYAGKTTLMNTLLDFLPANRKRITLQGYYEDFHFLTTTVPEKTYLVAEEISNHGFAEYLWGYKAIRTIKLLSQGYALGSTIHARNTQEVLYQLHNYLGLTLPALTRLGLVVNLRATAGAGYYDEPVRRVMSVDMILPATEGLAIHTLAARRNTPPGFEYQSAEAIQKVLCEKNLAISNCLKTEWDTRTHLLRHWLEKGATTRKTVRRAVLGYYRRQA